MKSRGRGGEGPEHKALKEYVAATPSLAGLRANGLQGTMEYPLASGDRVDVVFDNTDAKTAVEVKSRISTEGDIARGLYQCVKYRAVLEAQAYLSNNPFDVAVFLVLGGALPSVLLPLVNGLGVAVIADVMPA